MSYLSFTVVTVQKARVEFDATVIKTITVALSEENGFYFYR